MINADGSLNFDASQFETLDAIEAIPAGWYNAMIDESEVKPTKDGRGAYVQYRFTILDGAHANKKVWTRINLRNANPVAEEIARKELATICKALNRIKISSIKELHGAPLQIKVKVRAATAEYEAANEISGYKPYEAPGAISGAVAAPAFATAPATQNFAGAPQQWAQPVAAPVAQPAPVAPVAAPQAAPAAFPAWANGVPQVGAPVAAPVAAAPVAPATPQVQAAQAAIPAWAQPRVAS